jgi:hypothetical protein
MVLSGLGAIATTAYVSRAARLSHNTSRIRPQILISVVVLSASTLGELDRVVAGPSHKRVSLYKTL